jgi:PAS domain S-box-containing protein
VTSSLSIDHTVGMAQATGGLAVGGDVEQALAGIPVPSYVLDTAGVVRWINPAAERLLGDVRGSHFTSVVGPEDRAHAQELFARKVLGTTAATETSGVFVSNDGTRVTLEVSAVPLMGGEHVVGVFGLLSGPLGEEETSTPPAHLTPRQAEVLRLLEQGRSTKQIAQELHLSTETVRNHIRHLLRALGVHTRLEAVAVARHGRSAEVPAS